MLAETRPAAAVGAEPAAYRLSATDWALRAGVALVFSVFALKKLVRSSWVSLFAAIGYGQGFRYVTGAIQLGGSLLLLFPRTARLGAALIASTMVGAIAIHLAVLDTGVGGAIVPAALLPLIIAAGWKGRGQPAETAGLVLR
jgi:uncharacterized membrane protein YphA (DoxX/SURF4 family)